MDNERVRRPLFIDQETIMSKLESLETSVSSLVTRLEELERKKKKLDGENDDKFNG